MVNDNNVTDWYSKIPEHMKRKYHNPNYKKHLIKIPFRMLVIGASGSGKTQLALEIIKRMKNTFEMIILCVKSKHEPLYEWLSSKLKPDQLQIFEGIDNIPPLEMLQQHGGQILCIFDDLILEKDQSDINEYFIRARKVAGGVSCMYLTQSYYQTPGIVRKNCNYMAIKKLSTERDLKMILSEFSLGLDKKKLIELYKKATDEKLNFLMVDIDAESSLRFRKNFLEILS